MSKKSVMVEPDTWHRAMGVMIGGTLVVTLLFLAFVWPTITSKVKDMPLAVVGPGPTVEQIKSKLSQSQAPFEVETLSNRGEAIQQIKEREVFGAIIIGQQPEILTASANGPAVSQILSQVGAQMGGQDGHAPQITDVVPLVDGDKRGLGITTASLPLVFGGIIGGVLASLAVVGLKKRLAVVAGYSVLAGMTIALIMQVWLDILPGNYLANSVVITLQLLATSTLVAGMFSLFGRPGIFATILLTIFIANPLSGATQPKQFLLEPWGDVGQLFVPGAGSTLLRNAAYFPDASITAPVLVLLFWIVLGLGLFALAKRKA